MQNLEWMDCNVWYDAWVWMFATIYWFGFLRMNELSWWDDELGSLWLTWGSFVIPSLPFFPLDHIPPFSIGFWISWWLPMIIILWMNERTLGYEGDGYDVLFRLRLFLLCFCSQERFHVWRIWKNAHYDSHSSLTRTLTHTKYSQSNCPCHAIYRSFLPRSPHFIFSISLCCPFSNCTSSPTSFCEFPSLHQSNNNNFLFPFLI